MRSRLRPLALTLSFAALACADEPQVHVEARVGQIPESGADPQAAARILREMWAEPEHDVVDDPTTFVAQAPENVAAFDALEMGHGDANDVKRTQTRSVM